MTDGEMDELYELYLLGTLEPDEAAAVEQYLREHPEQTQQRMAEASSLAAAMAGMAEQVAPPPALRQRVLVTVAPRESARTVSARTVSARTWMYGFAGLAAACLVLAAFALLSRNELQNTRAQLNSSGRANNEQQLEVTALTRERDQLREQLAEANRTQQASVAALTRERDQLRTGLAAALGAQRTATATLTRAREQLDAQNRASQAQVASVTSERDQLRASLDATNSRSQAQVAALTNEVSQLRTALANAQRSTQIQLATLTNEVDQMQSAFAILRQPDTRSVRFGKPEQPHGWAFVNRTGGVVFVGSQLPQVAADRTLELWLVPKTGAPRPAGLFRPSDAAGDTVHSASLGVDPAEIKALAVSEEPRAGSSAPTTKPFLLVPLAD